MNTFAFYPRIGLRCKLHESLFNMFSLYDNMELSYYNEEIMDRGGSQLIFAIIQIFVVTLLMLVLFFGIGFILNMLLKTTWLPVYLYLMLVIAMVIYWGWDTGTLWSNIKEYRLADYVPAFSGLVGAIISGYTIQALRSRGFKMF
jgi:hypothetical protein